MPTKSQRQENVKRKKTSSKSRSTAVRKRPSSNAPVAREESIEQIRARHEKRQRRKKRRRRVRRTIFVTILLVIALICVIFLTPFFLIDTVTVAGNSKVKQAEILKTAAIDVGQNLFSLNTGRIENRLEDIAYIKTATIKRKLPKAVEIDVIERSIYCYIKSGEVYYAVDKEGVVLEMPSELDAHYTCVDMNVKAGKIGEKIVLKNQKQFEAFIAVEDAAKQKKMQTAISQINVTDPANIVFVYDGRITINFGDLSEADRKMSYIAAVGNSEQRNGSVTFDMDSGKTYFTAE